MVLEQWQINDVAFSKHCRVTDSGQSRLPFYSSQTVTVSITRKYSKVVFIVFISKWFGIEAEKSFLLEIRIIYKWRNPVRFQFLACLLCNIHISWFYLISADKTSTLAFWDMSPVSLISYSSPFLVKYSSAGRAFWDERPQDEQHLAAFFQNTREHFKVDEQKHQEWKQPLASREEQNEQF